MLSVVLVYQNQRHLQERGEEKGRELRDRSRYSFKVLIMNNVAWLKLSFHLANAVSIQVGSDAHQACSHCWGEKDSMTLCASVCVCVHVSKCV